MTFKCRLHLSSTIHSGSRISYYEVPEGAKHRPRPQPQLVSSYAPPDIQRCRATAFRVTHKPPTSSPSRLPGPHSNTCRALILFIKHRSYRRTATFPINELEGPDQERRAGMEACVPYYIYYTYTGLIAVSQTPQTFKQRFNIVCLLRNPISPSSTLRADFRQHRTLAHIDLRTGRDHKGPHLHRC